MSEVILELAFITMAAGSLIYVFAWVGGGGK